MREGKNKRRTIRVVNDEQNAYLIIDGHRYDVLDMSTDAVRFLADKDIFISEGQIEFNDGDIFEFKGHILRVDNTGVVFNFSEDTLDRLRGRINHDIQECSEYHDICHSDKRQSVRLKYPEELTPEVRIANQSYKIDNLSESAVKLDIGGGILALSGVLVFAEGDQYYIEGNLTRFTGNEAVLMFSNDGIPSRKIAQEALKNLDEYLF